MEKSNPSNIVELTAMGKMRGDCQSLQLEGPLEKARAFFKDADESVSTLKYYRGRSVASWGTSTKDF